MHLLLGSNAFGFEETGEAIIALLDCLQAKSAVLVGYSLGARLALYLAEKHGHRLQTVVSISGSPGLSGEQNGLAGANHEAGMLLLWHPATHLQPCTNPLLFNSSTFKNKEEEEEEDNFFESSWYIFGKGKGARSMRSYREEGFKDF